MKKIFIYTVFLSGMLMACNNNDSRGQQSQGDNSNDSKESANPDDPKAEKKISKRDYSITTATAYNNIFVDSMAMENFFTQYKLADSLTRRIRSFYNARNYQFAWFSTRGLTEQALGFWNLHNYATYSGDTSLKNSSLQKTMDNMLADEDSTISASDKAIINTEFLLTEHFIKYSLGNYEKGFVKRKEMERFIPIKKEDPMEYVDSLLTKKHKDNKYFDDVNSAYKLLKVELEKYYKISQNGGWQNITTDAKQLKKGASSPAVAALKKRLQITGDLQGPDSSQVFNDTLTNAIKSFQKRLGYTQDGVVTSTLIKDMNVPVEQRLEQIIINMNRMRWMPQEPEGKLILVNIPEFILHFTDGKNKVFDMVVVVGKEGHNTMMFTGKLSTVVFSPYWNVPPSIVKKEIEPSIARNPNYLASHHMERTPDGGVRQLPGDDNSLGKVKFLFPNSFNIYFHDTPAKSLFSKDKRAYSHGCVRLSDPLKMAEILLKDDSKWPHDKIVEAMNSGNEQFVKIKDPVPVFITYYTAWVDEDGMLNFRDDIYRRDASVAHKMFAAK